jgi:hypothetical protein
MDRLSAYIFLVKPVAPDLEQSIQVLMQHKPFLITSTGRTATRWLAKLLNKAENAYVVHEPVPREQDLHVEAILEQDNTMRYLREFRLREMALRIHEHKAARYGEVNSFLRFHIKALQELIPELRIIHLVRDGRDVVRSVLNRRLNGAKNSPYYSLRPPVLDEYTARWEDLTLFERVCWGWQGENRYMREHIILRARLEDITSSYDLLRQQILEPLGLFVDKQFWNNATKKPTNVTRKYTVSPWSEWTSVEREQFIRICGAEMSACRYDL